MIWRTQYDVDEEKAAGEAAKFYNEQPSLTQQQFTEEVNLNTMVRRMGITDGAIPPQAMDPRYFGDFTNAVDFRDSLDRIREAENRFAELPADLRRRFRNDPAELFAFVSDPKNDDEAVKLGLLGKLPPPEPAKAAEPPTG